MQPPTPMRCIGRTLTRGLQQALRSLDKARPSHLYDVQNGLTGCMCGQDLRLGRKPRARQDKA